MPNSLDLKVVISAVDKFTAPLRGMAQGAAQLTRQSGVSDIARGLGGLTKQLAIIGGVGAAAAGGVAAFAQKAASAGDNIAKTADKLGLGIVELQQLQHAADLAGISSDGFTSSMRFFNNAIGEAFGGTGEAVQALEWMGVTLEDTNGKLRSSPDLLREIADKFTKIEDPALRGRIAQDLFSRSGADMINMLKGGSASIDAAGAELLTLGYITEEQARASENFVDDWARMRRSLGAVATEIGMSLMPRIQGLVNKVRDWVLANRELVIDKAVDFIKQAAGFVRGLADAFGELLDAPVVGWLRSVVDHFGAAKVVAAGLSVWLGAKLLAPLMALGLGFAKLGVFMLATPFGLITLAIAGLIAAGWALYKNWDSIKAGLARVWQAMASVGLGVWQRLQDVFAGFWAPIKAAYDQVRGAFKRTLAVDFDLASINDFVRELTGVDLAQVGSDWMIALRGSMQQGWDQLKQWWDAAVLALIDVDWLQAGLDWAADLLSGIEQGWEQLKTWMQASVRELLGFFPDFMLPDVSAGGASGVNQRVDSLATAARGGDGLTPPGAQRAQFNGKLAVEFIGATDNVRVNKVESSGPVEIETSTGYVFDQLIR